MDILIIDDEFTSKANLSPQMKVNKLGNIIGNNKKTVNFGNNAGITLMKIPLLKFIYFIFLESEKISDEFNKYINGKLFSYIYKY